MDLKHVSSQSAIMPGYQKNPKRPYVGWHTAFHGLLLEIPFLQAGILRQLRPRSYTGIANIFSPQLTLPNRALPRYELALHVPCSKTPEECWVSVQYPRCIIVTVQYTSPSWPGFSILLVYYVVLDLAAANLAVADFKLEPLPSISLLSKQAFNLGTQSSQRPNARAY